MKTITYAAMSATVLALSISLCCGLRLDVRSKSFNTCNELLCGQITCVEDIQEDAEVSALVNMSIYTIIESKVKVVLASISTTEPKIRIYQGAITHGQGKMTTEFAALNLSFSRADESLLTFSCEVYYEDMLMTVKQVEKIVTLKQAEKNTFLLKLSLETNSSGIVKKVDIVSEIISEGSPKLILPGDAEQMDATSQRHGKDFHSKIIVEKLELQRSDKSVNNLDIRSMEIQNDVKYEDVTDKQTRNEEYNSAAFLDTKHQVLDDNLKTRKENLYGIQQEKQQVFSDGDSPYLWANCTRNGITWAPARVVVKLTNDQLALCDTQTDKGGWIVIQRRIKGDVNFTRDWNDYKTGFGSLSGDLWMGNDVISDLTSKGYTELRIDMTYKAQSYYAAYTQFLVQPETADYQMTFMTYTGNASDDLSFHNGMRFTTFDRDNDWVTRNCAYVYGSGWWFHGCHQANVNGVWGSRKYKRGVVWHGVSGDYDSLDFVEMKLRQV